MILKQCSSCNFDTLLKKLECTILHLSKKRYFSLVYNTKSECDNLRDLIRYKKILENRKYDCTYPCPSIKTEDIVAKATLLAFKEDCNLCPTCFPEII